MSLNGRAEPPRSPGFFISMVGLSEIAIAILAALFLDEFLAMPDLIAGLSIGQFIGLIMAIGGGVVFHLGRRMGWTPRGDIGSIARSGTNFNNNPVKRM